MTKISKDSIILVILNSLLSKFKCGEFLINKESNIYSTYLYIYMRTSIYIYVCVYMCECEYVCEETSKHTSVSFSDDLAL